MRDVEYVRSSWDYRADQLHTAKSTIKRTMDYIKHMNNTDFGQKSDPVLSNVNIHLGRAYTRLRALEDWFLQQQAR